MLVKFLRLLVTVSVAMCHRNNRKQLAELPFQLCIIGLLFVLDLAPPCKRFKHFFQWSANVARITEVPFVALVPNYFVQRSLLTPLRLQTGGSVLAGTLALNYGWAINIGGGFHHCSGDSGGGFCAYADITLLIQVKMFVAISMCC